MLDAKVDLAGVNVMAMDFGEPSAAQGHARRGAVLADRHARPARRAARRAGLRSTRALWAKVGVTVMIGQNDVDGERSRVADARALAALRRGARPRPRLDLVAQPRRAVRRDVPGHRDALEHLQRRRAEAAGVHRRRSPRLHGTARAKSAAVTAPDALPDGDVGTVDDPARSPYPIWQPEQAYREGYKVVWHQAVYIAKWYTQGQTPDAENVARAQSPWRLVGPVLAPTGRR